MRISDWSSDVRSSDLSASRRRETRQGCRPLLASAGNRPINCAKPPHAFFDLGWGRIAEGQPDVVAGYIGAGARKKATSCDQMDTDLPCFRSQHVAEIGRASCRERVCKYV